MANKNSSFMRSAGAASATQPPGVKLGPDGVAFISTGIATLDKILGGGFPLGTLVMIMEDSDAPLHLLLLRNFMSQGLVHHHPLLFAGPSKTPQAFLGTLPSPVPAKDQNHEMGLPREQTQEKNLRIAWQYKKYFGEQLNDSHRDSSKEYCNEFDLRKPLERKFLTGQHVECISIQDPPDLTAFRDRCSTFLAQVSRTEGHIACAGRIAIQSFCAPQCGYVNNDWDMLSFIKSLRSMVRSSNSVAVITFPPSVLSSSSCKRWQHLADTLLTVRAIPDEDKELAKLLADYQDMVGFLHVNKVARLNSQVPIVLETSTFSLKLLRRKFLVLERLNQAPVDGSSGSSYAKSASCSGSSKGKPRSKTQSVTGFLCFNQLELAFALSTNWLSRVQLGVSRGAIGSWIG